MTDLYTIFSLIGVGILWGCTNPLMKIGSEGITQLPQKRNSFLQMLSEFQFLFTRWQYLIPFLLNLSGSVMFFATLSKADLSLVAPLANSLTFLFTTITSSILIPKENAINRYTLAGIIFVLTGVTICVKTKL